MSLSVWDGWQMPFHCAKAAPKVTWILLLFHQFLLSFYSVFVQICSDLFRFVQFLFSFCSFFTQFLLSYCSVIAQVLLRFSSVFAQVFLSFCSVFASYCSVIAQVLLRFCSVFAQCLLSYCSVFAHFCLVFAQFLLSFVQFLISFCSVLAQFLLSSCSVLAQFLLSFCSVFACSVSFQFLFSFFSVSFQFHFSFCSVFAQFSPQFLLRFKACFELFRSIEIKDKFPLQKHPLKLPEFPHYFFIKQQHNGFLGLRGTEESGLTWTFGKTVWACVLQHSLIAFIFISRLINQTRKNLSFDKSATFNGFWSKNVKRREF